MVRFTAAARKPRRAHAEPGEKPEAARRGAERTADGVHRVEPASRDADVVAGAHEHRRHERQRRPHEDRRHEQHRAADGELHQVVGDRVVAERAIRDAEDRPQSAMSQGITPPSTPTAASTAA
jgi:hypothetical protein